MESRRVVRTFRDFILNMLLETDSEQPFMDMLAEDGLKDILAYPFKSPTIPASLQALYNPF